MATPWRFISTFLTICFVMVFAKEKVYAVDQSFQNGNRDAFNHNYGNLGGFTGQGGFGKQDKVNQYGNQQYGAFKGYGQGNYGKHGRSSFGEGAQGINNYGHAAGYGTQAQQGKGYGGYGHGGVGGYGGAINRGYGGYGATQAVAPILARPIAHGLAPGLGYGIGHGIGHGIGGHLGIGAGPLFY
nr:uncharacterized protein LOC126536661 [Dermacentor andersoni]